MGKRLPLRKSCNENLCGVVKSILFVCLGNICRSPLAEGVFWDAARKRGLGDSILADSAGTGGWHLGSAPDPRSIAVAARHGVDIRHQKARKFLVEDFGRFDLILGMDRSNVDDLRQLQPAGVNKVHLFIEYATGKNQEVPDPYFGGPDGFDDVYRMIRDASYALVDKVAARLSTGGPSGQVSSTT